MKYKNITRGIFLDRPNRFIAHVEVDGKVETVHVKNTGRCRELLIPGCEVWLTAPGSSGRKTKYDLVSVRKGNGLLINMDSQAPNKVVREWLAGQEFDAVTPEYSYGNSRIDFYMRRGETQYLMEVKGCTLEAGGIGYFPDAPTARGTKHLQELMKAKQEGFRAIAAFVIQMDGIQEVLPHGTTDPAFEEAFYKAKAAGVEILNLACHVEPDGLAILPGQTVEGGCLRP